MQQDKANTYSERNLLLTIAYDGKNYHGWQIQGNAITVQGTLQEALYRFLNQRVDIKGCSRTDAGVHAYNYCINFKTKHTIPCKRLIFALNRFLPKDIVVLRCEEVAPDFHARYSCKAKEYIYKIWNTEIRNPFLEGYVYHYWKRLDENLLNREAQAFVGTHDFTSFCNLDRRNHDNLVRCVKSAAVTRDGNMVIFKVSADGFLYNMVRIMVGTLISVARSKIPENKIGYIIEQKNRKLAGPTAISDGLYLNKIFY